MSDTKQRLCGSCRVNPATHEVRSGPGGRYWYWRCTACMERRSLSWITAARLNAPLPRLARER